MKTRTIAPTRPPSSTPTKGSTPPPLVGTTLTIGPLWALRATSALALGLFVWASWAEVDIVASAPGRLVPKTHLQIVQPAEAGVVQAILVHEGQTVEAGQVLMRLDPGLAQAETRALQEAQSLKRLQMERIDAELTGRELVRPSAVSDDLWRQVQGQLLANRLNLRDAIAQESAVLSKARHDWQAAQTLAHKLTESLPHYHRSALAFERLGDEGFFSALAVDDKRREWLERERDLQAQLATLAGMQAQVLASEKRLAQLTSRYQSELRTQRSELVSDLQRLDAELAKARHKSAWLELRAPQRGVIKELGTHTIGAVVSPGTVLMSIVPIDEPLLAEVWVRHEDAGFVHVGQKARFKIAAYPFQKYGMLDGEVSQLGADASNEGPTAAVPSPPTGSAISGYKALVRLDRQRLAWDGHSLELSAGMQVIADLHQGRRTVLDYLLSPVQKAWHEAARER